MYVHMRHLEASEGEVVLADGAQLPSAGLTPSQLVRCFEMLQILERKRCNGDGVGLRVFTERGFLLEFNWI
jgi:hypothetical protein